MKNKIGQENVDSVKSLIDIEEMHDWKIQRKKAKNRITTKEFKSCRASMFLGYDALLQI